MKVSIRIKLIVAILVPLLVVYLGVLAINYATGRDQAVAQAKKHLRQLASNHAARLDTPFAMAEQAAAGTANALGQEPNALSPARADLLLNRSVLRNPLMHGACIALEPGVSLRGDVARFVCRPERPPSPARELTGPASRPALGGPDGKRRWRPSRHVGGTSTRPAAGPATAPAGRRKPGRERRGPGNRNRPPARPGPALIRGDLPEISPTFRRAPWYLSAKNSHKAGWFGPSKDWTLDGEPVARYAVPIVKDEEFLGVVAFDLAVELLQRYVRQTEIEGGHCMLVDGRGVLVAHPQRNFALRESLTSLAERHGVPELEVMAEAVAAGRADVLELEDFHSLLPSYVAFAPVTSAGWSFAAVMPRRRVLAPVQEWFRRDMAVMLGGLGVIIVCMLLVSIRITRPIASLARAVRDLAKGNLRAHVHGVRSRDEIGEVARAFNGMVRALRHHVQARSREMAARKAVESELRVAREIQSSLLPRAFPRRHEFELHAMNVPAKEVAGDFFDFFFLDETRLAFLIADVSGKGVPAALFMAVTRTVIRDRAMGGAPPAQVLDEANRLLAQDNERTMFVTLFFAHYSLASGELIYANAGHNPPCVATASGKVRRLAGSTGPILGVFEDKSYEQRRTQLGPRDLIVLYTDGVTEAMDRADRQFRIEHLEQIIAGNPAASPEEICGLVVQSVEEYRAHPQQDDVTVLALRRNA